MLAFTYNIMHGYFIIIIISSISYIHLFYFTFCIYVQIAFLMTQVFLLGSIAGSLVCLIVVALDFFSSVS